MNVSSTLGRGLGRATLVLVIAWGVTLPLRDVLAYPDRISVLPNLETDALAYNAIATELAETRRLQVLPARHPPGWVTMLGFVYWLVGPSYVAGKLVSWLALVGTVVLCAVLARRVYAPAAGWMAALLCATAPAMRGYVGTLQYEIVTGTMLLGVLLLADAATRAPDTRSVFARAVVAGIAGGVLILTRETFLVVVPLIALWMAERMRRRLGRRPALVAAACLTAAAMTPAVIWSGIQSVRHGMPIVISDKGPLVVAFGNNPLANGTYNAPLVGVGEPTGLAYVRQAPGRSLVLAGRKALYFWGVLRDGWNVPRPAAVWVWRASMGLLPLEVLTAVARGGWLLVLFVLSLWWLGREGWRAWWILPAIVVMVMAVHMATVSSHRFAVPMLPVVFALVSGPLVAAARRVLEPLRAPAVAAAAALVVSILAATQFQTWPLALTLRAADLEGIHADNAMDPTSGRIARVAMASRGVRPVLILADEYLPSGSLTVAVTVRRLRPAAGDASSLARVSLVELNGRVACAHEIVGDVTDQFTSIAIPCLVSRDTSVTLAVESLGTVDFAIDAVELTWLPLGARLEGS